jgi:hypothetical protein
MNCMKCGAPVDDLNYYCNKCRFTLTDGNCYPKTLQQNQDTMPEKDVTPEELDEYLFGISEENDQSETIEKSLGPTDPSNAFMGDELTSSRWGFLANFIRFISRPLYYFKQQQIDPEEASHITESDPEDHE